MDVETPSPEGSFFHDTFVSDGLAPWVKAAYKYTGFTALVGSVLFLGLGVLWYLLAPDYAAYVLTLLIAGLTTILTLGWTSFKEYRNSVYIWAGITLILFIFVCVAPYGYQLIPALFFVTCLAMSGVWCREDMHHGEHSILLSCVVLVAFGICMIAFVRPSMLAGPTTAEGATALSNYLLPENFTKTEKGLEQAEIVYGYSATDIISGAVNRAVLLQRIQEDPRPFKQLVEPIQHSFFGYALGLFLATVPPDIL